LTFAPYFHIGILVADLEVAVDRFSSAMGLSFRPVRTTSVDHIEDPEDHPGAHRGTYAYEGPPYIELLEATGDSRLWSADQGEGMHHIGLWAPEDLDTFQDTLGARGFPGDVRLRGSDGDLMAWFQRACFATRNPARGHLAHLPATGRGMAQGRDGATAIAESASPLEEARPRRPRSVMVSGAASRTSSESPGKVAIATRSGPLVIEGPFYRQRHPQRRAVLDPEGGRQ